MNVAFNIDDVVRSATLHERWTKEEAVRFARRTFEVALIDARIGATMKHKEFQSNWKTTAKLAERALSTNW